MHFELTPSELETLRRALDAHLAQLQEEVAHTESIPLQRALHVDIDAVERVRAKVEADAAAE